jgi:hypothetical protein
MYDRNINYLGYHYLGLNHTADTHDVLYQYCIFALTNVLT